MLQNFHTCVALGHSLTERRVHWTIYHIYREYNVVADALANEALDFPHRRGPRGNWWKDRWSVFSSPHVVICLCRDYNGFMLLTFFYFPQLQYYALINIRMVSSSSVTRVSMHTAKRDQKQPCFVEYIRHLHVDLIFCCLANLGCTSGISIRSLQNAVNALSTMVS